MFVRADTPACFPARCLLCRESCPYATGMFSPCWDWPNPQQCASGPGVELRQQAQFAGVGDCFGPVPRHQLAEELVHVGFDRALGDEQVAGDVAVRLARGEQVEDFKLAGGQRFLEGRRSRWNERIACSPGEQLHRVPAALLVEK